MTSLRATRAFAAITAIFGVSVGWNSEPPRNAAASVRPAAAQRDPQSRVGKTLPDPVLLDGSAHPVEKKPDYGMIGDFELPGDENAQSNRVGGPNNPNQKNQKGGAANAPQPGGLQVQGLPMPMGMGGGGGEQQPSGGGAQAIPPGGANGAPGGGSGTPPTDGNSLGGGQAGGAGQPNGGGKPIAGGGQAGAQPQGIQVAELGGEGSGGGPAGDGGMGRPPPVTIGDKAMRIDPAAASPSTVGAQPKLPDGHVQQHKATGTGGKPPTSPQGPGRIEKGSVIPAGL